MGRPGSGADFAVRRSVARNALGPTALIGMVLAQLVNPNFAAAAPYPSNTNSATAQTLVPNGVDVGYLSPANQQFWYTLTLPVNGRLTLREALPQPVSPSGDYGSLELVNASGINIGIDDNFWNDVADTLTLTEDLTSGRYQVWVADNKSETNPFSLTASFKPADAQVGNTTKAAAAPLAVNGAVQGYLDPAGQAYWYTVAVPSNGRMTVALAEPQPNSSSGDYGSLELVNASGAAIGSDDNYWNNVGNNLTLTEDLTTGTYLVSIEDNQAETNPFRLSDAFTPADTGLHNTALTSAAVLPMNDAIPAYLFPAQTDYWYQLSVTINSRVTLTLTDPHPNSPSGDYGSLQLVNASGVDVDNDDNYWNNVGDTLRLAQDLAAGTYEV